MLARCACHQPVIALPHLCLLQKQYHFLYCPDTGWAVGAKDTDFEGWAFPFPGVTLIKDFVTPEEEAEMVRLMDSDPWKLSQSGRRKQVRWHELGRGAVPCRGPHAISCGDGVCVCVCVRHRLHAAVLVMDRW